MLSQLFLKMCNLPNALKVKLSPTFNCWYFRAKGVKIGKNFNVFGKVAIIGDGKISIGDNFCMTSGEHVNPISSNLQASFRMDCSDAEIHIGNNVGMSSPRVWIHDRLTIGDNVKIGGAVLIIDTDCHSIDYNIRRAVDDNVCSAPIVIEDDAWIGAQCVILKGVTIGARSIIGAGSVVTKSIPADCIAAGNPCHIIRQLSR